MTVDNVYIPQQGSLSDLRNWIAGELGSCLVKLYVSNTPYLATNVPGDYTEASFAGYAPIVSPAWPAPFINGSGAAESDSPVLTWTYTAGAGTVTVFGVFITDSTGTELLAVVPFQAPIVLSPASPSLVRSIQLAMISML